MKDPVASTIDDIFTFDAWASGFLDPWRESGDFEELILGHDDYMRISRALGMNMAVALRKIDDFLSDAKKLSDDLHCSDPKYNIKSKDVLGRDGRLLSAEERTIVNKRIAHLTNWGVVDDDDMDALHAVVSAHKAELEKLRRMV